MSIVDLEKRAGEVAAVLRALSNERRLMILCRLAEEGEASVNALADALALTQPALSQHLAVLREDGMVAHRREAQTLWYRIADPRVGALLKALQKTFCGPSATRRGPDSKLQPSRRMTKR